MIVYKIINNINGKLYVGQTVRRLDVRFKQHITCSNRGSKLPIHLAIKKYGIENFSVSIVLRCISQEQLNVREAFCIRIFNSLSPNGYNLKISGQAGRYSEETKQRMSDSATGRKHSEETKKKMSARSGIRNSFYGRKHKPGLMAEVNKNKRIKILCHQNGEIYESISSAAKALNFQFTSVRQVVAKERNSLFGYTFEKVEVSH